MKKIFISIIVIAAIVSCAKDSPALIDAQTQLDFFKDWMRRNHPSAKELKDGVFMEYVERGKGETTIESLTSWLQLNYTMRTMENLVFATRDSNISRTVGAWSRTTHFCDDFVFYNPSDTKFSAGGWSAMLDLKGGDHVKMYVPAHLGYNASLGMNIPLAYNGEKGVSYQDRPYIFELKIKAITDKPDIYERDSVEKWALEKWRLRPGDTIVEGIFMKKIVENPGGNPIAKDSTVSLNLTTFFTDKFIISTTSETIAKEYKIYDPINKSYYPKAVVVGNETDNEILNKVLPFMRQGETAEILTVSKWTKEGVNGDAASVPQILPYQPRIYLVTVIPPEKK
ncbi:hypothetical protein BN938_1345 [Mucinivorans hirudinis]|uniref:Peptidylprolyl isomerase n=1 Tax=Mucinivorans hirudinis TaxID=1433126 RepID=A0A060RCC1_9BACT|nr:hypothetical protein BN938_1345 [Mucinivorans hirudinis]